MTASEAAAMAARPRVDVETERLMLAYRRAFKDTPEGRLVLADLRAEFYDFDAIPSGGEDALFALGARHVVRHILDHLSTEEGTDDGGR